jgi:hypothetical protein
VDIPHSKASCWHSSSYGPAVNYTSGRADYGGNRPKFRW